MAFPCFDQPDLKARFTLDLERPASWSVIGNTAAVADDDRHAQFAEARPISTYLFSTPTESDYSRPARDLPPVVRRHGYHALV
jgi:hypothetical protein